MNPTRRLLDAIIRGRRTDDDPATASTTLADLHPGQRARVTAVRCDSAVGQRLLQLGLLEGTDVEVVRRAPAGDPLELRLMGYALSLRADEARAVTVEVRA